MVALPRQIVTADADRILLQSCACSGEQFVVLFKQAGCLGSWVVSEVCHSEAHILEAPGARWHPYLRCESLALFFGRHFWLACMRPFREAAAALPAMCAPFWSSRDEQRMEMIHAERGDRVLRSLVWAGCRVILPAMQKQSPNGPWPSLLQGCPPRKVCGALGKAKELRALHVLGGVGESDLSAEHPALS